MDTRNLLTKLLDYVLEQDKEIDPRGFKLQGYKDFIKTPPDLQGLPGVDFDLKAEGDHVWLRVARLEAMAAPAMSDAGAAGLLSISADPTGQPPSVNEAAVQARITTEVQGKPADQHERITAQVHQLAQAALAKYRPLWTAWAAGEAPRRKTIALYGDLFAIRQQLETEETNQPRELVWGFGVAAWQLSQQEQSGGVRVDFQYPLITQPLEVALVDKTLALEVRPRALDPRFEFDAFSACSVPGTADVERAARDALTKAQDRPVSPFDPGSFEPLLKLVAGNLHKSGRYVAGAQGLPTPTADLVVTDTWAILSRPRPNNYLHDDIERLKAHIASGCLLPEAALSLVSPPPDVAAAFEPVALRGLSGPTGGSGAKGDAKDLYFPLPYNQEQVTIIEQLERTDGVAVQGPPGTGKTHTIANIVCHFLATGRKVLVTSKGEKALEVLKSKIPDQVKPLTVALLAGDRAGLIEFQSSIEAILHRVSQLNPEAVREQIRTLNASIERAHKELAELDRRVDEVAQAQLSEIEVDGVPMRAQKMAELVVNGEALHGWFDDRINLGPKNAPPLSAEQAGALREARRKLGNDLVYVTARIPASAGLLSAAEIGRLHQSLVSLRDFEQREETGLLLGLQANTPEVLDKARRLLEEVEKAQTLAEELEQSQQPWPLEVRGRCLEPSMKSEAQALAAMLEEVNELTQERADFLKRPVDIPEAGLTATKALEAIDRAVESGKPFGLMSFAAEQTKSLVASIKVSGLAPAGRDDWVHVRRYTRLHKKVLSFTVRWNGFAQALGIPELQGGVTSLRQVEAVTPLALKAHELATRYDAVLPAAARQVFSQAPIAALTGSAADLAQVAGQLRSHLARADLSVSAVLLATLQEKLAGTTGPVSEDLRKFVETELGRQEIATEQAVARYAGLVAEVRRVEALAHDVGVVQTNTQLIEEAGAPKLAARVRTHPVQITGEDEAFPASWREAWNWARVKEHLGSIEARDELLTLAHRRRTLEQGLARFYVDLVSNSAWLSTKQGTTPKVLSALETYRTAVRRIGKGTGPNATRYRRDAQQAMKEAQGAVPCWVMSHSKVSETLPSFLGSFDLVIVDEASQSDLWALPAVLRGKKVLVVGDDKQVSPDGGFISAVRIQELKDRFLTGQPHAPTLTPEKSLYDIASTVFAAQKVMLREHFRCVPPIIAYSNTFYDGFIQPLRIPKSSERMDPPLVDIHVPNGLRSRHDVNEQEALAIAQEIEAIVANRQFAGRSLGVVSLLGPDQAKHIDSVVRQRVDAMELIRRNFACGDARVFQGSERDIMFLSMVVDPASCKALSGNMFEQRFNVAASRARDRMVLVRSVELSDLSHADLRRGLLEHFSKPLDGSVSETRNLINECESGFERDVYKELQGRGYRVVPQVKAGSFRIDMVVEGADDSRLAIECDGDEFHGPDRWAADMSRQRVLERAGWTFWRCFASTWHLRKDEVLQELLDRLAAMGIERLGAIERIPSLVEKRVWRAEVVGQQVVHH
jgi:very-short-patch-repair endonuclease